jgi:hydrogenase expression/formation protein HypC
MCLSIPAEILSISGEDAIVSVGGVEYKTSLQLVEDVQVGDFVLLHTGFALQKISKEEADFLWQVLKDDQDDDLDFLKQNQKV